jgi:hypothetical protein
MSFSFYLENGLGNIFDKNRNNPLNITGSKDPFKLNELTSYNSYVALKAKLKDKEVMQ